MRRILQICPHDSAPFDTLCARYVEAGAVIGVEVTSVFLSAPSAQPLAYAEYLTAADLSRTAELRQALRPFAQQSWDLVVCHRYRSYWAVAKSPLARNPCVVLAHEFGLLKRWQRRFNRLAFARRFRFAAVSAPVARELAQVVGYALVLPNVLDLAAARGALLTREQARARLGLEPGAFVVGVVGRLHYKKRPALAAAAFRIFRRQHPGAQLVFFGDGDRQSLGTAEDEADVRILGFVPHASRYMRALDVLLHPAAAEPFGMVVLEAMSAGVPVVVLPHSGPHDILGDLGIYPAQDTPEGFAAALQRAVEIDREAYEREALQLISERFAVPVLAAKLDELMSQPGIAQTPGG